MVGLAILCVLSVFFVLARSFDKSVSAAQYRNLKTMTWDLERIDRDYTECSMKVAELVKKNRGKGLSNWPANEKSEHEFFAEEVARLKEAHNSIATKYNNEMAKTNWRFTNFHYIPEGVENRPLPRAFKQLP